MSGWWPSGRYSPFGFYSPRDPPKVTDDDFDYIPGNDDDHHRDRHHSHHHEHSHHEDYGFPRHGSHTNHADLAPDVLNIKHKTNVYALQFPPFSISERLKVGDLRLAAADKLKCDDSKRVKLLYKGRSLRNDAKTCKEEGLKQNSELICVISSETPMRNPQDDDDESTSSASSSTMANGVDMSRGDGGPSDREPRSKRKNHRGGGKNRRDRENKETRYEAPERPRDRGESYVSRDNLAPPPTHLRTDHRSPSPGPSGNRRAPSPSPARGRGGSQPPPPPKPSGPAELIDSISRTFETDYLPKVQALLANPPADAKTRQFESKKLSEGILTQVLFKLDGVQTEDEAVKARRKECVKLANRWSAELDKLAN